MRYVNAKVVSVFLMVFVLATALLNVSQRVQKLGHERDALLQNIEDDLYDTHVLQAEWAYLTAPQNLQVLVDEYFDLDMPDVGAIAQDTSMAISIFAPQPETQTHENALLQPVSMVREE